MSHKRRHEETNLSDLGKTMAVEPFTWVLVALAFFILLAILI